MVEMALQELRLRLASRAFLARILPLSWSLLALRREKTLLAAWIRPSWHGFEGERHGG